MRENLFKLGVFALASGGKSFFKIDCEALTPTDWDCLARLAVERVPPFGLVHGVPDGGLPFATALLPYARPWSRRVLVAEDVWTTGGSMLHHIADLQAERGYLSGDICGIVAFARGPIQAEWIRPIFQLTAAEHE